MSPVNEEDSASLAWAERRGFREVGRNSLLVLDLEGVEAPAVDPPRGVEVVSWAERPDLSRGLYEVAREAYPDVPGDELEEMARSRNGCGWTCRARETARRRRSSPSPATRSSATRSSRSVTLGPRSRSTT